MPLKDVNGSKNILLLNSCDNIMSCQYVIIIKTVALTIAPTSLYAKLPYLNWLLNLEKPILQEISGADTVGVFGLACDYSA